MSEPEPAADPAARVERLRAEIRRHDHLYHVLARPVIADVEYDRLFRELQRLEAEHPELVTPDSPTQRVGAPVSGLSRVEHSEPMLSLENAFGEAEIRAWEESLRNFLKVDALPSGFSCEPKFDGVSIEVVYRHGVLAQASTRGDGRVGEDVTHSVATIATLRELPRGAPALLELRGEVLMSKASFLALNRERLGRGEEPFANPRNLTAGTLKQLDPELARARPLEVFFYGLGRTEGFRAATQRELLERLEALGLPTSLSRTTFGDLEAALRRFRELERARHELPFEIDGMVIKVDDLALRERLGTRTRSPRWALAAKFPAQQATTRVEDIRVQVGRLGTLTPVACLVPVEVGGVTVSRATLHNEDQVRKLDVRVGDTVFVERAGDVIPRVVLVVKEARGADVPPPFAMPEHCPECGTAVARTEGEVAVRCPNAACPARVRGQLEHFVSRGGLDLDGFGPKLLEQLVATGKVRRVSDLFALGRDDMIGLERMGEKSVQNLLAALDARRRPPLDRLLNALGIPNVGEHVAGILAEHYRSLAALEQADRDALLSVKGIGPEVADSVARWFADPENRATVEAFARHGVEPVVVERAAAASDGPFAGRTVLFTGTLESMARAEAEALVRRLGGRILKSVSKNLDLLVAGADPGSKLTKARDLGVRVLDEAEFLAAARGAGSDTPGGA